MKTDQEMMESLNKRRAVYRAQQKKRRAGILTGALCLAFFVVISRPLFMGGMKKAENDVEGYFYQDAVKEKLDQYQAVNALPQSNPAGSAEDVISYSFSNEGDFECYIVPEDSEFINDKLKDMKIEPDALSEYTLLEIDESTYAISWKRGQKQYALFGKNVTSEQFIDVYEYLYSE